MIGTLVRRFAIVITAIAAAASLAGCATAPRPFSIEEKVWFDMATGADLLPPHREPSYAPYPPPGYGG